MCIRDRYPEGPKCPLPDHQQKRDHINFLYQLQNDTSYLQYVTTTLDSYAEAGYPQSITDDFIREAYHALPVVFKVDDKSALAAMSDTLSHLNTCETRDALFSTTTLERKVLTPPLLLIERVFI